MRETPRVHLRPVSALQSQRLYEKIYTGGPITYYGVPFFFDHPAPTEEIDMMAVTRDIARGL